MHSREALSHPTVPTKSGAFREALLLHPDRDEILPLYENLARAEREETCIRRAVFLMLLLLLLALAGLGYCAILLPDVFHSPSHLLTRSLLVLALGSLIAQAAFLGYLLWQRSQVARLHAECRRLVLALARSPLEAPAAPSLAVEVPAPAEAS